MIKPILAYAVIKKSKMKLNILDIFKDKPEIDRETELLVRVEIKVKK